MYKKRSGIMLAKPFEERRLLEAKFGWKWPVICQPKLDGERCRAVSFIDEKVSKDKQVILISSEMNVFNTVPHIRKALEANPIMTELDGELYCHGMSFEEIHSICSASRKKLHPRYKEMQYHVFDLIIEDGPDQISRLDRLHDWFQHEDKYYPIKRVGSVLAFSIDEVMIHYYRFLENGYEGIIIRHMGLRYTRKRSGHMLKFKPKKEDTYEILGIEEAISLEGDPKGMLGAIRCSGNDGEEFRVGAGNLTHAERVSIFNNEDRWRGRNVRVQYQNITNRGVPRFGLCVEIVD